MKLYISLNKQGLQGCTNIDISTDVIDLGKLDEICKQAECTSIILDDVLKFIPHSRLQEVLQHIASRLRHSGKITLIFNNLHTIVNEYYNNSLDEEQLNYFLFKDGARSSFSSEYILQIMRSLLSVTSFDIDGKQVTIIAERR